MFGYCASGRWFSSMGREHLLYTFIISYYEGNNFPPPKKNPKQPYRNPPPPKKPKAKKNLRHRRKTDDEKNPADRGLHPLFRPVANNFGTSRSQHAIPQSGTRQKRRRGKGKPTHESLRL